MLRKRGLEAAASVSIGDGIPGPIGWVIHDRWVRRGLGRNRAYFSSIAS